MNCMNEIKTLGIDLETYSSVDLNRSGVYRYAESPDFEILLFGYSVDEGPVTVVDVARGEEIPEEILKALTDGAVEKWAYNAQFERVCLSNWLRANRPEFFRGYGAPDDSTGGFLDPAGWRCSRVWGAYLGLPLSLKGAGSVLNLDGQKMEEGGDLMRFFCRPCAATARNGGRTRNLPEHDPDAWSLFREYNRRDVEVELGIRKRPAAFPVPDHVWDEYRVDQEINDRGIALDMALVENAIAADERTKAALKARLRDITGLENPNSVSRLTGWLSDNGVEAGSLDKKTVGKLLAGAEGDVADALECRRQLAKSSVSKYAAMKNAVCADGRARGMFAFYGASRTGRWAGRIIQLQNLPQNHMEDLAGARALLMEGDLEALEQRHGSVPNALSELIRTAFIPKPGYKFIVADFSSIEARVLAFLAGEQWVLDEFASGGDIYCATASRMFGVPVVKNGINGQLRQKGKQATLSCGYGGSVGALKAMGALEAGMREEELKPLVDAWRRANPNIVRFWRKAGSAAVRAVNRRTTVTEGRFSFTCRNGMLFIGLPSGRCLSYAKPSVGTDKFGREAVTYEGIKNGKWARIESSGPKFVENIVQAVSRDILACAMKSLSGCFIVGHVHDELIIECPEEVSVEEICETMGRTPPWLQGLQLRADGYECRFYRKE